MEKINIRNLYIELLNKIRNVEGVDKDYVDGLIEIVDREITSLDSDINAIISVIPEEASATDPLVITSDLAAVAFSGSYNDLENQPTIPAAQVNSDWDASSGVAQILNKPTLATVATSGSYNDLSNKPTIPAVNVLPYAITREVSTTWYLDATLDLYYQDFNLPSNVYLNPNYINGIYLVPTSSSNPIPTSTEKSNYSLIQAAQILTGGMTFRIWAKTTNTSVFNICIWGYKDVE